MLAGLLSIPHEYYEAARMDGADVVAAFRRITLPLLQPVSLTEPTLKNYYNVLIIVRGLTMGAVKG